MKRRRRMIVFVSSNVINSLNLHRRRDVPLENKPNFFRVATIAPSGINNTVNYVCHVPSSPTAHVPFKQRGTGAKSFKPKNTHN